MTTYTDIPQPKKVGLLGNLPLIDAEAPLQSVIKLSYEYGPIFRMEMPGREHIYLSGHKLVQEACDESRFDKNVWAPLQNVRPFTGDGLFTSWTHEPNWKKAHHILLPSFSQRAMQGYHNMMVDIGTQLVQKWARLNPDESVNVPEDMTRLTLDTIGLCGFNYRFNSFYRDQPHPFIISMTRALDEAMSQLQRLGIQDKLMITKKRQYKHDIEHMFSTVDKIIAERREGLTEGKDDLLSHMLNGKDPETGETLDDENIRYQMITFLIAGHETTSGLLSFAIYYLLKNKDKLQKAYEEVDRVLVDPLPSYKQVRQLDYIRMILNEALRLWPTAPAFSLYAKEDTVLDGQYHLNKGDAVSVLIPKLHRDTEAWGEDVEEFRPERFEDDSKVPHHAYKPFGNGQRACIGQQFALHEATLVLGMVLKHFEIIDHTDYQLKIKETLTLKPDHFTMKVKVRKSPTAVAVLEESQPEQEKTQKIEADPQLAGHNTPLLVLYGSNLGTAEGIARELAETGHYLGFRSEVGTLDQYAAKLPTEGAVLIVTASYNGNPPDNAKYFVDWLQEAEASALQGVKYAVFGCGDHNWASTYQKIPHLVDQRLTELGAQRLYEPGEGDASDDFEKQLDDWKEQLWPQLMGTFDLNYSGGEKKEHSNLSVSFVSGMVGTPLAETYDAFHSEILENRELQHDDSGRSTRHIEVSLPVEASYREGDHLGILPQNPASLIKRVTDRFHLKLSDHLLLKGSGRSAAHLPLERPVSLPDLLGHSVELQDVATRAQIREVAAYTVCPPHRKELEALLDEEKYKTEVLAKRITMLDLIEQYEACEIPFDRFLELLPPLKPRYYSISSSPKVHSDRISITVSVVRGTARSGKGEYRGIASNYLAEQSIGSSIVMFIRRPQSGFQLPDDPATPIIMVGPGTGVAPFRGFLQAREVLQQEGNILGQAHLYFGCRHPQHDFLYREELEQYAHKGIVTLHTAFSREQEEVKVYVQHQMKKDAQLLIELIDQGAHFYICGDGTKMAPDVEQTLREAYQEVHRVSEEESVQWLDNLLSKGQYAKDVWTGI